MTGTISLLLLLRRRAKRNGSSTEEVNKDPRPRENEGRSEREETSAEGPREYFGKLIEETNKRSRSSTLTEKREVDPLTSRKGRYSRSARPSEQT